MNQRWDLTDIGQLPQGTGEVQAARQALRYDDAAQPGRQCGAQPPVRVFDNDALGGAKAVLSQGREVGLGVGLGMPVVFAYEREIDAVQQAGGGVDDLKVLPPRTGDDAHAHRAVELAQHLAGAVDDGYAGAQEFGVAGVAPDAGGLQRLFVYAVFGGDLGKTFAGLEKELDETGFAQADAEAFQGFAAGLEVQAFGVDQDAVVVPKNGFQHGTLYPFRRLV